MTGWVIVKDKLDAKIKQMSYEFVVKKLKQSAITREYWIRLLKCRNYYLCNELKIKEDECFKKYLEFNIANDFKNH